MRAALVLIACAACGSPMPAAAPPPDAQVDATIGHGRIAHVLMARSMSGTTNLTIPAAVGGDWIEVIVAHTGQAHRSTGVQVGIAKLVDASGVLPVTPCGAASELWIDGAIGGAWAGTDDVVIARDDDAPFSVMVVDVVGVDQFYDEGNDRPARADPGSVVLSTFTTCGAVTGLAAPGPFTALDVADRGTSIAFAIPTDSGMYAAQWNSDGSPSAAYTVSFR